MYGGTKTEMERLIADANKVKEANGEMADLTIDSFADVAEAIHIIQDEMDITGTTAREASETIEGSLAMTKSAWDNLLTGIADDNADFGQLVDNFVESIGIATDNVLPRLEKSLEGISKLISELMPVIFNKIPSIIAKTLPNIAQSAVGIVQALIDGISENKDSLFSTIIQVVETISTAFLEMLPEIVQLGLELIVALAEGIAEAIPELIPVITDTVLEIVDVLTNPDNIGSIIDAALQIMVALGDGLIQALPELISRIPEILLNIGQAFIDNAPSLIEMIIYPFQLAGELIIEPFRAAWEGIKGVFATVGEWFGEKFQQAKESATNAWADAQALFTTVWGNIKSAFVSAATWFSTKFTAAKNAAVNAWDGIQSTFSGIWGKIKAAFVSATTWFSTKFTAAKNATVNAWNGIKSSFSTIWGNIKSAFNFSDAFNWGRDMISNFISGVKNMWGSLTSAISQTAQKVRNFLHFSEPDEGPLSDFHTYAPDMMNLFAKGMTDNIPMLGRTARDAAQAVANGWDRDYNIPSASVSYNSSAVGVASAGMINSGVYQADTSAYPLTVNLVLPDGEKLASYMLDPLVNYSAAKGTPILQPI